MQGRRPGARSVSPTTSRRRPRGAVTWIDRDRALVARDRPDGGIAISAVDRDRAERTVYLGRVACEIGDRDRLVIMGPGPLRTELEREYVVTYRRPDRLLDVEPAAEMTEAELVRRLDELNGRS